MRGAGDRNRFEALGDEVGANRGGERRQSKGETADRSGRLHSSVKSQRWVAAVRLTVPWWHNSGHRQHDFSPRLLAVALGHDDWPAQLGDDSDGGATGDTTDTPQKQVIFGVLDEGGGVAFGDGVAVLLHALCRGTHAACDTVAVPLGSDAGDDSAAVHERKREAHFDGRGDWVFEYEGDGAMRGEFVERDVEMHALQHETLEQLLLIRCHGWYTWRLEIDFDETGRGFGPENTDL